MLVTRHERQAEGPALAIPSQPSDTLLTKCMALGKSLSLSASFSSSVMGVKLDENWKTFSIKAQCTAVVWRCQLLTFQRQSFHHLEAMRVTKSEHLYYWTVSQDSVEPFGNETR